MANSKYLKRRFSLREIIFMIILVAVLFFGLYFWLVYYPIQDRIAEFNAKKDELQLAIDVDKAREYFSIAAANGHEEAAKILKKLK